MADRVAAIQGRSDVRHRNFGVTQRYADIGPTEGMVEAFAEVNAPAYGIAPSATLIDGSLATSTTAAPLEAIGAGHACAEVYVQNADAVINILVGNALAQEAVLTPGQGGWFTALFTSQIYVKSASGTPNASWLSRAAVGGAVVGQTTTAAALATNTCAEVLVMADINNTVNVLVGNTTSQHIALTPGASLLLPVANSNVIFAKSASATVNVFFQCHSKL